MWFLEPRVEIHIDLVFFSARCEANKQNLHHFIGCRHTYDNIPQDAVVPIVSSKSIEQAPNP